jgi:EpsI family protein
MGLLNHKYGAVLLSLLLLQTGAYYALEFRGEKVPAILPLATFPPSLGAWRMVKDIPVEKEVQDVLRADDTLNRIYFSPGRGESYLWIAYFKSTRYGQSPHSPKNCLPGSGWEPVPGASGLLDARVPDWSKPITINRYVVQHGDERSVSLYWYQSHGRVIAEELSAKFWLVADSIRYRRSDSALVRVSVPVTQGVDQAVESGVDMIQALFPALLKQIPF